MKTASNSRVLRTIPILIAFCLVSMPAQAQYGGGTGEPNNPYQIATAEDLNDIGNHEEDWDKCFILVNDIDLSAYTGTQFNVIGRWFGWSHPDNKAFSGVFDGDGKVIRNFTWSSVDRDMVALFAFLGRNANGPTVKNLGLENVNIRAEDGAYIGALVAHNNGGLANCYVTGYVSGEDCMGGLVGFNFLGDIINCHSFATVEGNNNVGGLVGINGDGGDIDLSFSHSTVSGRARVGGLVGNCNGFLRYSFSNSTVTGDSSVGGLVGANRGDGTTVYCYARGSVTGTTRVGGLAGANEEHEDVGTGLIQCCYSSATVRGEGEHIGGLVGYNNGNITSSFWDMDTSGQTTSRGGTGKTTAEMQIARTFFSWGQCDLEVTWTIDEGNDYPRLWWENQPGDPFPARLSGLLPGSGTEDDPYLIYTAEDLNLVGLFTCDFDRYFKLMADIDLTRYVGDEFNIIGIDYRYAFTGVFDGNGKRISNFTYTSMDRANIGLFGYVVSRENDVVIKDLGLIDPNIDAPTADRVGALVGHLEYGTLSNCYVRGGTVLGDGYVGGLVGSNGGSIATSNSTGAVTGSGWFVGGLVGYNDEGSIVACYSNGVVSGDNRVGGLAGRNCYSGNIAMSYSTGTVSGTDWGIGGLVGQNWGGSSITTSYSTGAVSGYRSVGGLVGRNSRYGSIATSFSTGTVTGNEDVGGFVGRNQGESAVVSTCFWDTETSGLLNMCGSQDEDATGCDDSYGKTTTEMQTASTFLEAGWDFVDETVNGPNDIWKISEGLDYPHLWWEKYGGGTGDPNDPYLIYTDEQMNAIGAEPNDWDKHFKLMADIDLSSYTGTAFNIIGERYYYDVRLVKNPFAGVFDGNGKRISNFSYTYYKDTDCVGLFGYVEGENAEIKDLGLIDPNVDVGAGGHVGSLVGYLEEATISNCYVQGGSVSGNQNVGGLVGYNGYGTITNCYSTGTVSGNQNLGGLVGQNNGDITSCYSNGNVSGNETVGGLVGQNEGSIILCHSDGKVSGHVDVGGLVGTNWPGSVTTSYSTGTVTGADAVGGLVGNNYSSITASYSTGTVTGADAVGGLVGNSFFGSITTSYSTGTVTGADAVGGLVGYNYSSITTSYSTGTVTGDVRVGGLVGYNNYNNGRINSSFWDIVTSGQTTSAGGIGLTTSEIQDIDTFLSEGWDFDDEILNGTCDYWQISPGDYPTLRYHLGDSPVMPEGLGTTQQPYLIRDARDLGTVWFEPLAHYRLETSVDLSGITWSMAVIPWFNGTFDGSGQVISNLHIQGGSYLGLFGRLGSGAIISNMSLEAVDVNGINNNVGGLAGRNDGSIITRCYSTGSVSGNHHVGGLVGGNWTGSITMSYSTGTVTGEGSVGGLVGEIDDGSITTSYSTGTVTGAKGVGGLLGVNDEASITTSYSTGTVTGNEDVGGLVGGNWTGSITLSYSTGAVTGNNDVGGLVGHSSSDSITSLSFWDMEASGQPISAGGTGKTTAEM